MPTKNNGKRSTLLGTPSVDLVSDCDTNKLNAERSSSACASCSVIKDKERCVGDAGVSAELSSENISVNFPRHSSTGLSMGILENRAWSLATNFLASIILLNQPIRRMWITYTTSITGNEH